MTTSNERADLLETLATHRGFLLHTVQGLSEEQARTRPTVSALCLGGIVKHVTAAEAQWANFIVDGAAAFGDGDQATWAAGFALTAEETLDGVIAAYRQVAARTDELARRVNLDAAQALPTAPWFPPGATWTARRVLLHIIAETAQHAGHADILRESIDGQRTMG